MNQKEAIAQGLTFTGMYASIWKEDEINKNKKEAKELRKIGIRCVQVKEESGFSWYADPDYFKYQNLKYNKSVVEGAEKKHQLLKEEYERKLMELDEEISRAQSNIDYMKKKYGGNILDKA